MVCRYMGSCDSGYRARVQAVGMGISCSDKGFRQGKMLDTNRELSSYHLLLLVHSVSTEEFIISFLEHSDSVGPE